jgi:hypothetical protein
MNLSISEEVFRIDLAEVYIELRATPEWCIHVIAERRDIEGLKWEPMLYAEQLPVAWLTLESIACERVVFRDMDEPALLSVFRHSELRDSSLSFGKLHELDVEFTWRGVCDMGLYERFADNVVVLAKGIARIRSVSMPSNLDEMTKEAKLRDFLGVGYVAVHDVERSDERLSTYRIETLRRSGG